LWHNPAMMIETSARARGRGVDTARRILDVAEELAQVRGFNGFSYSDVAQRLQITNASLHYHFPGKASLGVALIERYRVDFGRSLAEIEHEHEGAVDRLTGYAALYAGVLRSERMCLCGMLAAEYQTLPEEMRAPIVAFFDENERWLSRVLEQGRANGELAFEGSSDERARALTGALEGAMLVARLYGEPDRLGSVAGQLIGALVARARR
jgi:TetR/AcrR family transcriptional repressor of nem operon